MNEYINNDLIKQIAINANIKINQVNAVLSLLSEDATVPFIARYRKEVTGGLDEDQIRVIEKEWTYGKNLLERKEAVIKLIDEKKMLTPELRAQIEDAQKLVDVEDLYRPYKEKKKTKATEAVKLGLKPLADKMLEFPVSGDRLAIAEAFVTDKVKTPEEALEQARYIVAEAVSDEPKYRKAIRKTAFDSGKIITTVKKNAEDPTNRYENYYEYEEPIMKIKPHRILAINRAEKEKVITVNLKGNDEVDLNYLYFNVIKNSKSIFAEDVKLAINDAYKRLIFPSITREVRRELTDNAEDGANNVFSMNLKNLLLQAPVKTKTVLGVDPAFRTGCKLAVVDKTGKVLDIGVIYPNEKSKGATVSESVLEKSKLDIVKFVKKYGVDIITIGNGTASRETESFIAETIKEYGLNCQYVIVSEAGASVYSASKLAQEEFPDYQVEQRSAVSIARRLQDPLSELVKIDPKAIGVGQYQHDVSQKKLTESLDSVIEEAVNSVGVNVNTASVSLLNHVSGFTKSTAKNVVAYRNKHGQYKERGELLNVSRFSDKTYEQAIGFLRIIDGSNPLDKTSIHPESYEVAEKIAKELDIDLLDLGSKETILKVDSANISDIRSKFNIDKYTCNDILQAFKNPTLDPRDDYPTPKLRSDILHLEDLTVGDKLEGTVRNVVDFGCFVDCGLKNDGLVHISKMSKKYCKHPSDLVSVGDLITVYVIGIDTQKQKLSLSMIDPKEL